MAPGVLRVAENFMTSCHKKEQERSCDRAIDLNKQEHQGIKETATKHGGAKHGTGGSCQRVQE